MATTVINNVWSPWYGHFVRGVQQLIPEWEMLRRAKKAPVGLTRHSGGINWPVDLDYDGGIHFTVDGGSLARASSPAPVMARDDWTYLVGRFELSYDVLKSKGMSKNQIISQLAYQAKHKLDAFRRVVSVGFYGYPDNILFTATGAGTVSGSDVTVTVDSLYGDDGALPSGLQLRRYLKAGRDYVNIHDGLTADLTDTAARGDAPWLVKSINEATGTLTLTPTSSTGTLADGAAAIADGDAIVLANQVRVGTAAERAADSFNRGLNGLLHLTRGATVHNIDEATNPDWSPAFRVTGYNDELQHANVFDWMEAIGKESGKEYAKCYTTTKVLAAAGADQLSALRYAKGDSEKPKVGFTNVTVGGKMTFRNNYCPAGTMFMTSKDAIMRLAPDDDIEEVIDSGEIERDGMEFQQEEGTLMFHHDNIIRTQMMCNARKEFGIVQDITELA